MKTIFNIIVFFSLVSNAYSQHVLTSEANMFRVGDVIHQKEISYFPPGNSGEDIVWDFSNLETIDEFNINYIQGKDSACTNSISPTMINKYMICNDTLRSIGYETPLKMMNYTTPMVLITYPFSFGDNINNPFRGYGTYCDTKSMQTSGQIQTEADAYGRICIHHGDTINNVLRIHTVRSASLNMNSLNDTTIYDINNLKQEITDIYQWYGRGYRYPLFETVSKTIYNNMVPVSVQQHAFCFYPDEQKALPDSVNRDILYNDSVQAANDRPVINYNIDVSSSNVVTINYSLNADATINSLVCNHMGFVYRRSSATNVAGSGYTMQIDCSGLNSGIYILYLNVNGKVYSEKVNIN